MRTLTEIQLQLNSGQFEFSRHAFRRAVERNVSEHEIREAGAAAELIEDQRMTNMPPAHCCSDSPQVAAPSIFK